MKKEIYKQNSDGYSKLLSPSDKVTISPFINSPVAEGVMSVGSWRATEHRVIIDAPDKMPTRVDCDKMIASILKNSWFLRSALPAILAMEQNYSQQTGIAQIKFAAYGITGLTPNKVNLDAWQVGKPKPLAYPSTIGRELHKYMHLFTAPATGQSDNGKRSVANHFASNKVDTWIDGKLFSPSLSLVATYVVVAGIKAVSDNSTLKLTDVYRALVESKDAIEHQGAVATIVIHGVSKWHRPDVWAAGYKKAVIVSKSQNPLSRGLAVTKANIDPYWEKYLKALLVDLPTVVGPAVQKAINTLEWDGSTEDRYL